MEFCAQLQGLAGCDGLILRRVVLCHQLKHFEYRIWNCDTEIRILVINFRNENINTYCHIFLVNNMLWKICGVVILSEDSTKLAECEALKV